MGGLARAVGRLLVMGAVLAGVLITCLVAGVATTIAVALAIVLAGMVGLVGVARRPASGREGPRAVLPAESHAAGTHHSGAAEHAPGADAETEEPAVAAPIDPEALMPRWRRPSLLEARRADPGAREYTSHTPLRFGSARAEADLRIVRYAVVPVLDRPDEVLGARLTILGAGDEVEVVESSGAFLEVICPSGERGWIHRMTISQPSPAYLAPGTVTRGSEAEDALTALLAARGIQ